MNPSSHPTKHLSWTALSLFWSCPEAWRRQYLEPDAKRISTTSLVTGSVIHSVVEQYTIHRFRTLNSLPSVDVPEPLPVKDLVRKYLTEEWPLVKLTDEERMLPMESVFDGVGRTCERGAQIYIDNVLPETTPAGVETEFNLTHPSWNGWSVKGYLDRVELAPRDLVCDIKTSKRTPEQNAADVSDQLTLYALAFYAETKRIPVVQLDYIVLSARTHVLPRTSFRTIEDLQRMVERIAATTRAIDALLTGNIAPLSPALRGTYGRCKPSTCGFYQDCPLGGGPADPNALSDLRCT